MTPPRCLPSPLLLAFLLAAAACGAGAASWGPRPSLPPNVALRDPTSLFGRSATALSCGGGGGTVSWDGTASLRSRGGGPDVEESGDEDSAVADGDVAVERREEEEESVEPEAPAAAEEPTAAAVEVSKESSSGEAAAEVQAAETNALEGDQSEAGDQTDDDGGKRGGRSKRSWKDSKSAAKYAKKLKNRNRMNFQRKILHASFGLFFSTLNHVCPRNRFVPGMAILTGATLFMELMRYRKGCGWMNDALHFCLGSQLRKHEMEGKFTGSFYYFLGVTCTAYLFPKSAASMGMAQLALADPSASYFGRQTRHIYWSRIENGLGGFGRNKGFLGFLGGALFCLPYNLRVLSVAKWGANGIPGGQTSLLAASLALGLAGAFADLAVPSPALTMPSKVCGISVPPFHIDDNLVVPVFSGWACTKIFEQLGWSKNLELAKYILF